MNSLSPERISNMLESMATASEIKPPINIDALARSMNLEVTYQNMLCEGSLEIEDDMYIVRVNAKSNQVRQRFTIAHEIGHLIVNTLSREEILNVIRKGFERNKMPPFVARYNDEKLCDFISAFLLVPPKVAKDFSNWRNFSIERCQRASRVWQVSISTFLWSVFTVAEHEGGFIWYKITPTQRDPADIELNYCWSVFPKSRRIDIPKTVFLHSSTPRRLDYSIIDLKNNEEKFFPRVKFEFNGLSEFRAIRIKPIGKGRERRVLFAVYPKEFNPKTISVGNVQQTIL